MKLLLTGANGQLGREICRQCRDTEIRVQPVDLPEVDISRSEQVRQSVAATRPQVVVNTAAYTAVDAAETDAATAFAVNAEGPGHLSRACATAGIPLIHLSTDYVFDGTGKAPYTEDAPLSPIGVYGRSKARGEEAVRRATGRHVIVRTAWLYSVYGTNFVKTMLRLGAERDVLQVVDDQRGCPTSAADLAAAVILVARRVGADADPAWGTFHFCGRGDTTWHHFAEAIFEIARRYTPLSVRRIEPVSTEAFRAPAPRPAFSVLSCERIRQCYGVVQKPWRESLRETVIRLLTGPPDADVAAKPV